MGVILPSFRLNVVMISSTVWTGNEVVSLLDWGSAIVSRAIVINQFCQETGDVPGEL
jgi:hypothetical protein